MKISSQLSLVTVCLATCLLHAWQPSCGASQELDANSRQLNYARNGKLGVIKTPKEKLYNPTRPLDDKVPHSIVGVILRNMSGHNLINMQHYVFSGQRKLTAPNSISAGKGSAFLLASIIGGGRGAVGVVTWEIEGTPWRLALCYSNPYDRNLYENWFKFTIVNKQIATDKALYQDMYYNYHKLTQGDVAKAKDGEAVWSNGFKMSGKMTTDGHSDLDLIIAPKPTAVAKAKIKRATPNVKERVAHDPKLKADLRVVSNLIKGGRYMKNYATKNHVLVPSYTTMAVTLNNDTKHNLINKQHYVFSGSPTSFVSHQSISAGKGLAFGYSAKVPSERGVVGVVTWEIGGTPWRLALCYSNPGDHNLYENWFKFTIVNKQTATDKALYQDMYYNYHKLTQGNIAKAKDGKAVWSNGFKMSGQMTTGSHAELSLTIAPQ